MRLTVFMKFHILGNMLFQRELDNVQNLKNKIDFVNKGALESLISLCVNFREMFASRSLCFKLHLSPAGCSIILRGGINFLMQYSARKLISKFPKASLCLLNETS